MRLWSIHPSYLDAKGIVALWREGLLARKVLAGKTRGYKHHPQLQRFRKATRPLAAIDAYLEAVAKEATTRGYSFDVQKIRTGQRVSKLPVTDGQLAHEVLHLRNKLIQRDPDRLKTLPKRNTAVRAHPLFRAVQGPVEDWEKLFDANS